MFFEAECLPVDGALVVAELPRECGGEGFVVVPAVGDGVREFVAEEPETVGSEEAAAEEVEEWIEDRVLFDSEHAWVSGGVGDAALVDVLAAVPVGAFLVAAFHAVGRRCRSGTCRGADRGARGARLSAGRNAWAL